MKKVKEYGIRKLNSILNDGDLIIITKTPTIADDDCYIELWDYIEFTLLKEYTIVDILDGEIYIHHYTDDEEYISTYKFRPTRKDREDLLYLHSRLGLNNDK